jgi:hypothetical protein
LFSRTQTGREVLPSFLELEARLLDEEMQLKLDAEKDGESEAMYLRKTRPKNNAKTQNSRSTQPNKRNHDKRSSHEDNDRRTNNRGQDQRPKNRTFKKRSDHDEETCHYCGETGHFERECHLKKAIDRVKTLEDRLKSKKGKKHPHPSLKHLGIPDGSQRCKKESTAYKKTIPGNSPHYLEEKRQLPPSGCSALNLDAKVLQCNIKPD